MRRRPASIGRMMMMTVTFFMMHWTIVPKYKCYIRLTIAQI